MARPTQAVAAPLASAPRFGLLASIPPSTELGDTWKRGISYSPEGCVVGETFNICESVGIEVTDNTVPAAVSWEPYVLSVSEICSTFSGRPEDDRVRRLLNMDTERQLGAELWDGASAQVTTDSPNTWLANGDADEFIDLSPDGAVGFVHALACLQNYLATNNGGQQGVIHATSQVVTHWESFRLLRREGNRILTMQDHVVVPSPGYSGNPPSGGAYGDDNLAADDDVWAYATDLPRIFLAEPDIYQDERSIDRRNNTVRIVAQRFALVEWQRCRHAGIRLAVDLCGAGGS